jgi:hypothetical protein
MLSSGYLQPFSHPLRSVEEERESSALSAQEQFVLAQERALKATSGPDSKVSTTYRYSIGPDGRHYMTGAYVSIVGEDPQGGDVGNKKVNSNAKAGNNKGNVSGKPGGSNRETEAAVRELKRIEQEVIAHEAAHQAAGGSLTGAATYSYTQGPDGRSFITGGEVSIHIPASSDPEKTLRDMEQVQRAALAPGSPSGQDLSVAGKAAAAAAQARQELAAKTRESGKEESVTFSSGISSVKAGLLFDRIHVEGNREGYVVPIVEEMPDAMMLNPTEAYGRSASSRGLWALGRGFEAAPRSVQRASFDIAA